MAVQFLTGNPDLTLAQSLRVMASKDCVLSFRTSGPNQKYRTKQMASGDARDPWVAGQQIGTKSLKDHCFVWLFLRYPTFNLEVRQEDDVGTQACDISI